MRPDVPSDPQVQSLALPEGPASYTDEGVGPAVVCIHGLPGSSRDFRWLAPALNAFGLRALRLELPGFGQNHADVPSSVGAIVDHVRSVLSELALNGTIILGHSFGAVIAMRLAVCHPDAVSRLVLLSPPGLRQHRGLRNVGWGLEVSRLARAPVVGTAARAALVAAFRRAGFRHDATPETVVRTLEVLRSFDFGAHASAWSRLKTPTAMAWCGDDPFIEDDISVDLARRLPAGPRLRFVSGGHSPQKHFALEIAECLAEWTEAPKLRAEPSVVAL